MAAFFDQISRFFDTIGTVLLNFVEGLLWLFRMIPEALTMVTWSVGFLPGEILAYAFVVISISVVFLILGR